MAYLTTKEDRAYERVGSVVLPFESLRVVLESERLSDEDWLQNEYIANEMDRPNNRLCQIEHESLQNAENLFVVSICGSFFLALL